MRRGRIREASSGASRGLLCRAGGVGWFCPERERVSAPSPPLPRRRTDSLVNGTLEFKEEESRISKATRWEQGCPFEGPDLSLGPDRPGVPRTSGVGIGRTCQDAGSQARPQTVSRAGPAVPASLCPHTLLRPWSVRWCFPGWTCARPSRPRHAGSAPSLVPQRPHPAPSDPVSRVPS